MIHDVKITQLKTIPDDRGKIMHMLRTDSEKKLYDFAQNLKIPFINGLSPNSHPAQIISDILNIGDISEISQ